MQLKNKTHNPGLWKEFSGRQKLWNIIASIETNNKV
jgi:hypothetical protein